MEQLAFDTISCCAAAAAAAAIIAQLEGLCLPLLKPVSLIAFVHFRTCKRTIDAVMFCGNPSGTSGGNAMARLNVSKGSPAIDTATEPGTGGVRGHEHLSLQESSHSEPSCDAC
jgi:hypothetical protein